MTREEAIQTIEGLYPADSEYSETGKIGAELLEQAKRNVNNWRNESDTVLFEYARLCERLEEKKEREWSRKENLYKTLHSE